jgi:regulator of protease activity HflC (stomatin/prohibitin superfamily)
VTVPFILTEGIRMAEWSTVIGGVVVLLAMALMWRGFFILEPNEACVVVAWGEYRGSVRESGFYWTNPLARKIRVSLRAQSLCVERIKIHDNHGTPIELSAVVEWRIIETARASFDVCNVADFVRDQCGIAARHLASNAADSFNQSPSVMRRSVADLQSKLKEELQERIARAGVAIDEVRLTQRCEHWAPLRTNVEVEA